jgi:hypothetical protein
MSRGEGGEIVGRFAGEGGGGPTLEIRGCVHRVLLSPIPCAGSPLRRALPQGLQWQDPADACLQRITLVAAADRVLVQPKCPQVFSAPTHRKVLEILLAILALRAGRLRAATTPCSRPVPVGGRGLVRR